MEHVTEPSHRRAGFDQVRPWMSDGADMITDCDIEHLRNRLADRLDQRPMGTWSCTLIRAVLVALDVVSETPLVCPQPTGPLGLSLVR
ncbi:hypothetical protein C1Y40_04159 [Mycobacterium talmoniae]|uniref:Uncharacterized protein n=1 Tax=Mycobacterium talmoniae TaxID=1858794 RepID=A0A2S8BGH2_9MYCO|nr:hypothetical protein C1Y40_04159 [Mycobacterium talmoniae]